MKIHSVLAFVLMILLSSTLSFSQNSDIFLTDTLDQINVIDFNNLGGISRMADIQSNVIYAGKKSEVIRLDNANMDLSSNNARQVFGKVPGLSIWENDGSGIQIGVATRGLSPNRSWEFSVRQNGYDISSDVFGYPESYFSPPMEALDRIEIIRGAASLQFGPQFGGLLNYQIKKGDPNKPFTFEAQQTLGSYGLCNSYFAIGGTIKRFSYYGYIHYREAEGWRDNSKYKIATGYLSLSYLISKKIKLSAEYTKMDYRSQQAGGLTDLQFQNNPQTSSRSRNWFGTPWNVASLTIDYSISNTLSLTVKSFLTMAERNSVGFVKPITTLDSINNLNNQYAARQVDRDAYNNFGAEARLSWKYKIKGSENVIAGGIRAYNGQTKRNQLGTGTTGNNFDLNLSSGDFLRSLNFDIKNYALFAENIFAINSKFKLIPGVRMEYIQNSIDGYINTLQNSVYPDQRTRKILLYGIGSEYQLTSKTQFYANYSRAFRPVTFSEITPSATTEIIDPSLDDATGFNFDFGYRGVVKNFLNFDIGVFYLAYNNRIGSITKDGNLFRTNIGNSDNMGIESYIEFDPTKLLNTNPKYGSISFFASNSFISAIYSKWNNPALVGDPAKSIEGKRVENAPQQIHRYGMTYAIQNFAASFNYSLVGSVYTDASNTELPNANSTVGKLPGYQVLDISLNYHFLEFYNLKIGANNLLDKKYATRRSGGYPGPGVLPGNGRTFFFTFGVKF